MLRRRGEWLGGTLHPRHIMSLYDRRWERTPPNVASKQSRVRQLQPEASTGGDPRRVSLRVAWKLSRDPLRGGRATPG